MASCCLLFYYWNRRYCPMYLVLWYPIWFPSSANCRWLWTIFLSLRESFLIWKSFFTLHFLHSPSKLEKSDSKSTSVSICYTSRDRPLLIFWSKTFRSTSKWILKPTSVQSSARRKSKRVLLKRRRQQPVKKPCQVFFFRSSFILSREDRYHQGSHQPLADDSIPTQILQGHHRRWGQERHLHNHIQHLPPGEPLHSKDHRELSLHHLFHGRLPILHRQQNKAHSLLERLQVWNALSYRSSHPHSRSFSSSLQVPFHQFTTGIHHSRGYLPLQTLYLVYLLIDSLHD